MFITVIEIPISSFLDLRIFDTAAIADEPQIPLPTPISNDKPEDSLNTLPNKKEIIIDEKTRKKINKT